MKCWKCGNEITPGASKCLICGADQNRSVPMTDIGKAMRQLYDRYGRDDVLGKKEYLDHGLADVLNASGDVPANILKLRRWIRTAMEAGLGQLYLEKLNGTGSPDESFYRSVLTLMTEDVGLSEKASEELRHYFDEMIGWKQDHMQASDLSDMKKEYKRPEQVDTEPIIDSKDKIEANSVQQNNTTVNQTRKLYLFEIIGLITWGVQIGRAIIRGTDLFEYYSIVLLIGIGLAAVFSLFRGKNSSEDNSLRKPLLSSLFVVMNLLSIIVYIGGYLFGDFVGFDTLPILMICSALICIIRVYV